MSDIPLFRGKIEVMKRRPGRTRNKQEKRERKEERTRKEWSFNTGNVAGNAAAEGLLFFIIIPFTREMDGWDSRDLID